MLRNFFGNLIFLFFLPIWTLIFSFFGCLLIVFSLGKIDLFPFIKIWAKVILFSLKILINLKVKYVGKLEKNCILAPQHHSLFEIISLAAYVERPIFIFKKELLYFPFFGWCMLYCGMIPVHRKGKNSNWLEKCIEKFNQGHSIIIFPEGKRVQFGIIDEFKHGIFTLATTLKQKLIPVALDAGKFWPKYAILKKSGISKIIFGTPIEPTAENLKIELEKLIKANGLY